MIVPSPPQDLFREWDNDGDGVVSLNEFLRAMPLLGIHADKKEVTELFEALDHDSDGVIAFREFNRLMRRSMEDLSKATQVDSFGRVVESDWRPKTPPLAVVDVANLRRNVRVEHRLRGLDRSNLPGIGPVSSSPFSTRPLDRCSPNIDRNSPPPGRASPGLAFH